MSASVHALPLRAAMPAVHVPGWLVRDVLAPFLVTRLLVEALGLLALRLFPALAGDVMPWTAGQSPLLTVWDHWDTHWYLSVVWNGYQYTPGQPSNVAFAPLLPLLLKAGSILLGRADPDTLLVLGLLIANAALLGALGLLYVLVRDPWDAALARRSVLCVLVFPSSFFPVGGLPGIAVPASRVGRVRGGPAGALVACLRSEVPRPHGCPPISGRPPADPGQRLGQRLPTRLALSAHAVTC